jgi:hypothetical protein
MCEIESEDKVRLEHMQHLCDWAYSQVAIHEAFSMQIQKFLVILTTAVFVYGWTRGIDKVFVFVPLFVMWIVQFYEAHYYAYVVRVLYAQKLETELEALVGTYPSFHAEWVKTYFFKLGKKDLFFLPFAGAIVYTLIILLAILLPSLWRAWHYLGTRFCTGWAVGYLCVCALMVVYTAGSFAWAWHKVYRHLRKTGSHGILSISRPTNGKSAGDT